jgi:hypothetical protein
MYFFCNQKSKHTHEVGKHKKKCNKHTPSKRPELGGTEKERNNTSNMRKGGRETV